MVPVMDIDACTKFFFLLGNPVRHSLSPLLYNTAFRQLELNWVYLAAPVLPAAVGAAVNGLRALDAAGGNVASPHKEAVVPFLDELSPEAALISSVKTIVNRDGKLCGYSTDGPGFFQHLEEKGCTGFLDDPLLIVGIGGAARAIAYTLARRGAAELLIANRTAARAREYAVQITKQTPLHSAAAVSLELEALRKALQRCRIVIYSLPLDSPVFMELLADRSFSCAGRVLFDLRYHPAETEAMRLFRERGGKSFNGKGMLFWQAVLALEQFLGQDVPAETVAEMRRAYGSF